MASKTAYSRLQITLHWLIALLIAAAWFTHDQMRVRPGEEPTGLTVAGVPLHVGLGIAVFVLLLIRISARLTGGAPAPAAPNGLMQAAETWGHRLLYLLMITVPFAGMLRFFSGIRAAGDIHGVLANTLAIVALAHAAIAIFHQVVLRDGTLRRMSFRG